MRVLLADDHPLFRDGLKSLLTARGIEVVGEASNGREAVEYAKKLSPDIVLMDLTMPEMDGLAATRAILSEAPQIRIVILTASDDEANLFEAIKSGALGYILKNLESERFFSMLEDAGRGEPALTPRLAARLLIEFAQIGRPPKSPNASEKQPDELTEREREVLELLAQGVTSNKDLASRLVVSENTVKYHLRNIMSKLHLQNRAQVVAYTLRHGINPPGKADTSG